MVLAHRAGGTRHEDVARLLARVGRSTRRGGFMTATATSALNRRSRWPALVAAGLGLGHAAVSAYWLVGGTALLDTVGGRLEEWARQRSPGALAVLAVTVAVKVVVALSAPLFAGVGRPVLPARWFALVGQRPARVLGWIAAGVLIAYGGALTLVGQLAQQGVFDTEGADPMALAWHAYVWDPWFLAWGVALLVCLRRTRRG
jgi:hypothetical protein